MHTHLVGVGHDTCAHGTCHTISCCPSTLACKIVLLYTKSCCSKQARRLHAHGWGMRHTLCQTNSQLVALDVTRREQELSTWSGIKAENINPQHVGSRRQDAHLDRHAALQGCDVAQEQACRTDVRQIWSDGWQPSTRHDQSACVADTPPR